MSRTVRLELTEAQARALFSVAAIGIDETEVYIEEAPGMVTRRDLNTANRALAKLVRAYGQDDRGAGITGRT